MIGDQTQTQTHKLFNQAEELVARVNLRVGAAELHHDGRGPARGSSEARGEEEVCLVLGVGPRGSPTRAQRQSNNNNLKLIGDRERRPI